MLAESTESANSRPPLVESLVSTSIMAGVSSSVVWAWSSATGGLFISPTDIVMASESANEPSEAVNLKSPPSSLVIGKLAELPSK